MPDTRHVAETGLPGLYPTMAELQSAAQVSALQGTGPHLQTTKAREGYRVLSGPTGWAEGGWCGATCSSTNLHVGSGIPQHAPKGDGIGDCCQVDVEHC